MAVEDKPGIFPGGARAVHVTNKPICRALGIENSKHRRGAKETATQVLMRRLLSLDDVIERPALGWLPTEEEKVSNVLTGNTTRAGCALQAGRQPSTLSAPSPWNVGNRQNQPYQVRLA